MLGQAYKQSRPTPDTDQQVTSPVTPGTDANAAVAITLFDGNGRPYQTTDADGTVSKTIYDPTTGQPGTTIVDTSQPSGSSTQNGSSRKTIYKYLTDVTDGGKTWRGIAA